MPNMKTKTSTYRQDRVIESPVVEAYGYGRVRDLYSRVKVRGSGARQEQTSTYLSLSDNAYTCTNQITYETGPKYINGLTPWRKCVHTSHGEDRLKFYANSPWMMSVDMSEGTDRCPPAAPWTWTAYDYKAGSYVTQPLIPDRTLLYQGYIRTSTDSLFNPLSVVDTPDIGPSSTAEAEGTTIDDLISRYFPEYASDVSDYLTRNASHHSKLSDLNELLHKESLIYSNLLQAVPIIRLLAGGKKIQRAALWLQQWRSRFAKRPFLTCLRQLASTDLIYRFVVETTIADSRDFMASFGEVQRLFELGHATNGRDWTRLAHRPPPLTRYSTVRESTDRLHLPTRPTLPASGLPNTSWEHEYYDDWGSSTTRHIESGVVGNRQFQWYGYNDFQSVLLDTFAHYMGDNGTIRYRVGPGFTVQRHYLRWVQLRYKNLGALSPLKVWANRVGITKPLDSAWDLIPFSFVCDYFLRIGDWIEGISNHLADFMELRGDIIAAQPLWYCDKWQIGQTAQIMNYDEDAFAKALRDQLSIPGGKPQWIKITVPRATAMQPSWSRFSRYPAGGGEICSQLGILRDGDLSSVRKRTLAELAFMQMDKGLSRLDKSSTQMRDAITTLKLESRNWRGPNKIIRDWSIDQFDDYLSRTLKQFNKGVKALH